MSQSRFVKLPVSGVVLNLDDIVYVLRGKDLNTYLIFSKAIPQVNINIEGNDFEALTAALGTENLQKPIAAA